MRRKITKHFPHNKEIARFVGKVRAASPQVGENTQKTQKMHVFAKSMHVFAKSVSFFLRNFAAEFHSTAMLLTLGIAQTSLALRSLNRNIAVGFT